MSAKVQVDRDSSRQRPKSTEIQDVNFVGWPGWRLWVVWMVGVTWWSLKQMTKRSRIVSRFGSFVGVSDLVMPAQNFCVNDLRPTMEKWSKQIGLQNYVHPNDHREAAEELRLIADKYADRYGVEIFQELFTFADQYMLILPVTLRNIGIAIGCMIVVSLLLIPSFISSIIITLAIISIDAGVLGYMSLWNVNLDAISMITIIMSIGFAVDLTAHISYAYVKADCPTSHQRAIRALQTLGWPVFQGAFSTIIGIMILSTVKAYMILVFFKTVFLVIVFGLLHSLIFIPVVLTIIMPSSSNAVKSSSSGEDQPKKTDSGESKDPQVISTTLKSKAERPKSVFVRRSAPPWARQSAHVISPSDSSIKDQQHDRQPSLIKDNPDHHHQQNTNSSSPTSASLLNKNRIRPAPPPSAITIRYQQQPPFPTASNQSGRFNDEDHKDQQPGIIQENDCNQQHQQADNPNNNKFIIDPDNQIDDYCTAMKEQQEKTRIATASTAKKLRPHLPLQKLHHEDVAKTIHGDSGCSPPIIFTKNGSPSSSSSVQQQPSAGGNNENSNKNRSQQQLSDSHLVGFSDYYYSDTFGPSSAMMERRREKEDDTAAAAEQVNQMLDSMPTHPNPSQYSSASKPTDQKDPYSLIQQPRTNNHLYGRHAAAGQQQKQQQYPLTQKTATAIQNTVAPNDKQQMNQNQPTKNTKKSPIKTNPNIQSFKFQQQNGDKKLDPSATASLSSFYGSTATPH